MVYYPTAQNAIHAPSEGLRATKRGDTMLHYNIIHTDTTRGCVGAAMPARAVILSDMIGYAVRRAVRLYGCPDICSRALISARTHGDTVRPSACPAVPASTRILPRPHGAAVRPVRAVCCRPDDMPVLHLRGFALACLPCAGCPGRGCARSGAAVGCPGALPLCPVENLTSSGDITFLVSENGFGGLERAKRRRGRGIPCETP